MNLVFLCNILRILVFKLHSHPNEPSNFRLFICHFCDVLSCILYDVMVRCLKYMIWATREATSVYELPLLLEIGPLVLPRSVKTRAIKWEDTAIERLHPHSACSTFSTHTVWSDYRQGRSAGRITEHTDWPPKQWSVLLNFNE